jgi:hypothetical protein
LFWLLYWKLALPSGTASDAAADPLLQTWIAKLKDVQDNFSLDGLGMMAKNLLRFLTWQNPAVPALAILALPAAVSGRGPLRSLTAGIVLTLVAMAAIMPYQGHGWGYRYLHGFLGAACLLAAASWVRISASLKPEAVRACGLGIALAGLFSVLVLVPIRAHQVRTYIRPYLEASEAIAQAQSDVVVVDATNMFFAPDLVRNDPFLRNHPKVMDLVIMRERHIRAVCAEHSVTIFDRQSTLDIRPVAYPARNLVQLRENRRLMRELGCGESRVKAP